MFGGGKGMGGGGGGGGRVLKVLSKSVSRAGVTNFQETISASSSSSAATGSATSPTSISRSKHRFNNSSNNNSVLSLSSASGSPFSACNAPVPANNGGPNTTSWPYFPSVTCDSSSDEFEWISVDGSDEERTIGVVSDDHFLGPVPSLDEVHGAVSALTQVFDASSYSQFISDRFAYNEDKDSSPPGILNRVSPAGSDLDWVEPSPHLCNSRMLHPYGPDRVYDAFHLLQSEPAIQRMVISLSSDKAVWNAVLNNDVVRQLRDSYNSESVTSPSSESSESTKKPEEASEDSNPAMNVVKWMFQNTMAKFMELLENITSLLNELFKAPDDQKKTNGTVDPFEDKLRTSFLLSVVVLLVVVVNRANTA